MKIIRNNWVTQYVLNKKERANKNTLTTANQTALKLYKLREKKGGRS